MSLTPLLGAALPSPAVGSEKSFHWVEDYGAKCDGATDDARAIQSAIDANPGRKILFPSGVCVLGAGLKIVGLNTALEGQGSDTTSLLFVHSPPAGSADVVFTAAEPTAGPEKSYIKGGIRHLAISHGSKAASSGAGLQVVQASGFAVQDVAVHDAFIGMDFVGGTDVHITDAHMGTGGGWTQVTPGSRCMRFREQPLAAGKSSPASNMYIVNLHCGGIGANTEHGIEIGGADTLLFDNVYICCVAQDVVHIAVDNADDGAYVAAITFNGGYFDGSPGGQTGLSVPYQKTDKRGAYRAIALNGTLIGNFSRYGIRLEAPELRRFSATGVGFGSNAINSVLIRAVGSAAITGGAFRGLNSTIRIEGAGAVGESLAIVGNVWDTVGTSPLPKYAIEQDGAGEIGGQIAIVGNAFGSYLEPVHWQGKPSKTYKFIGNTGDHVGAEVVGAMILKGGLSAPVTTVRASATLTLDQSVVLVQGETALQIKLPPAQDAKGFTYAIKNATALQHVISEYINMVGAPASVLPPHLTLRLVSDGTSWQQL